MENKNEKVSAREYYFKLDEKPSFTQLTKTGISDNLHNVFRFADEYHRDQSKWQTTSQKETIDRIFKTLFSIRRHGLIEKDGYSVMVKLLNESIEEAELLLKETEQ